ncbi:unnamed protein product [Coregonus sp. 'balchen']|nr:unnamed protein product [Coregonus sp. 'balchen']
MSNPWNAPMCRQQETVMTERQRWALVKDSLKGGKGIFRMHFSISIFSENIKREKETPLCSAWEGSEPDNGPSGK